MLKNSLLAFSFFFLFNLFTYSQTDHIQIHFKDVHSNNVCKIAVHPEGTYFFTADVSGKIIMWQTSNYSYIKTIYKGSGMPIRDMRISKDGEVLICTEGMQGRGLTDKNTGRYALTSVFNTGDTLVAFYPFSDKPPVKRNISCDILGHEFDDILLFAIYNNGQGNLYGFDYDFSKNSYFNFPLEKPVHKAAINTKNQWLAYTCNDFIHNTSELIVLSYSTGDTLYKKFFEDEILEIVFDVTESLLHIICYSQQKQALALYYYDMEKESLISYDSFITGLMLYPYVYTQKADSLSIIIDTEYIEPLILRKDKHVFKKMDFNSRSNYASSTAAAFIPSANHLVIWSQLQQYYGHNPELHVFDYVAGVDIQKYYLETRNNISAAFLPGNNWYVEGNENNISQQLLAAPQKKFIKFYKNGTFSNRFSRLLLKDFMQINYELELMDDTRFVVDKKSGSLVFAGFKPHSTEMKYYIYDLINNEIDSSFKQNVQYPIPLSYRSDKKILLASGMVSFEGTRAFTVMTPDKTLLYNDQYTHGELSEDGKYILLCDTSATIKVFEAVKKKPIYENKTYKMNNLKMGAIDESSFWLSYSYWDTEQKNFAFKSLLLEYNNDKYIERDYPRTAIVDIATHAKLTAILFDNFDSRMLFINDDKKIVFSNSEMPLSISINEKGDKLMVVLKNGMIQIYETETMSLLGSMIHPNNRTHIILSQKGYFSSNTEVAPYLYAKQNGVSVPLQPLEEYYNRPSEVLHLFGQEDGYYAEMLKKTSLIRKRKYLEGSSLNAHQNSKPLIKKITYDGVESISVSDKRELTLSVEFVDSLKNTVILQVKINNSIVVNEEYTNKDKDSFHRFINCNLPLLKGDNIINIKITDANGAHSEVAEHFILCNAPDYPSDLYILAIGVSDYHDARFNLTFADKDALDMALFYGDTLSVPDFKKFKDNFFGERFAVNLYKSGKKDTEIRFATEHYGGNHYFDFLQQVDYEGNYWLEKYNNLFFLWDFNNSSRKKIELPELNFSTWSLEPLCKPSCSNDGFFYKNEKGYWYKYVFTDNKSVHTNIPSNAKFISLINKDWLTDTFTHDNSIYQSIVTYYNENAIQIKQKTIEFDGYFKPELLAASPNGTYLLYALHEELWLVDVATDVVKKIKIEKLKHELYRNTYYFDKDNTMLTCLQILYEDEGASYNYYVFDIKKSEIEKNYIKYEFNKYNGINNAGAALKWMGISAAVGKKKEFLFDDYISQYNALKPVSFRSVFIETLTNEQATKNNIINTLNTFFNTAKVNDQLILFLAGHGVLDTALNYWFAPYDMDFNKPEAFGLGYDELLSYLKKAKTVRKLLIMDSCHSGDIFDDDNVQMASTITTDKEKRGVTAIDYDNSHEEKVSEIMLQLFDNVSSQHGITVLSASSGTDVAYESPVLSNGAFTTAFIESIDNVFKGFWGQIEQDKLKTIELTEDFIYDLQRRVIGSTKSKQIPNVREINKLAGIRLW